MTWGLVAVAGASLVSGVIGANAASSAANKQEDAANNATALQKSMFDTTSGYEAPFRQGGTDALTKLSSLLGVGGDSSADGYGSLAHNFGMGDFQLDPGIQFQQQYGQQALQNSQAAKNGVLSGGALKDLMSFNQGLAGTGYQSAYDRFMGNKGFNYDSLMKLINVGQSAASNTANTGANYASGISNTMVGAGQAGAAGQIGVANALTGGINNASQMYFLRSLMGGGAGGGAGGGVGGAPLSGDPMSYTA